MDDLSSLITQAWELFTAHAWAGLGGVGCMVFVVLLTDRSHFLPTWNSPLRTFLGTILGAGGLALTTVQKGGTDTASVLINLALTTLPTLLAEWRAMSGGKSDGAMPGGTGAIDLSKPKIPAPSRPPSAAMVAVGLALATTVPGCAAFQKAQPDIVSTITTIQADIQEASIWISIISDAAQLLFGDSKSDAAVKFKQAEDAAKLALVGLTRAANGAVDVATESFDAAYAAFKDAWKAFVGAAKAVGVVAPDGALSAKLAGPKAYRVPELHLLAGK